MEKWQGKHRHQFIVPTVKMGFLLLMALMIVTTYTDIHASSRFHAPGNVYYVALDGDDNNPGTLDAPWRTIQKAADTITAGETVLVRGGVYEEFVTITSSGSESEGYLIFQAYPGERPIIDGSRLKIKSGQSALVQINSANYIVFDGFEVRNLFSSSESQYPGGIRVQNGGSYIHLLNNDVHHIENRSPSGNAHGIHIYGNSFLPLKQIRISGNRVHHLTLGASESLTLSGNIDGFVVDGNVIHDNNNIGIDIAGFYGACSSPCRDQARNGIVSGNTVYHIDSSINPAYGSNSNSAGGIYADGATNVIIERNHIYRSDFGIELASENQGKSTSKIIVRNNYIHHNDGAGIIMGGSGKTNGGAEDNLIANNTLVENDQLKQGYGEITFQENTSNNTVVNNLIYALPGRALVHKSSTTGSGNEVDYNLYHRPDGENSRSWKWDGHSYKTWDSYKEMTGLDDHSIFADPQFADLGRDILLSSSSPAIHRGTEAFTKGAELDFYGSARRRGTAIDIGATQFSGDLLADAEQQPTEDEPSLTVLPSEPEPSVEPSEGGILVDGNFSDWTRLPVLSEGKSRVRQIKSVIADEELHVLVTGSLLGDKGQLYLNTDQDADTGFQAPFWNGSGADYLLENGTLYQYSGEGDADWSWTKVRSYKKDGKFVATSTVVEVSLRLEDLGIDSGDPVNIGYVWKDSHADKLPQESGMIEVHNGIAPSQPNDSIKEETAAAVESAKNWSKVEALSTSDSTPRVLKVTHDRDFLYILVEGSELLTKTQIYLNTDNRSDSGYKASNWTAGGAEYLLEYGILYRYTGTGSSWSWKEQTELTRSNRWDEQDERIEIAIPLKEMGLQQGDSITLGVLKDDNSATQLPVSGDMQGYTLSSK